MKTILLSLSLLTTVISFAQTKDTLTKEQATDLLNQLNIDSAKILSETSAKACGCIDSIQTSNTKGHKEYAEEIAKCIDEYAGSYMLMLSMMNSLKSGDKNIVVNFDKQSDKYIKSYRSLERWLRDSCNAMNELVIKEDKESEFSLSKNEDAMDAYRFGVKFTKEESYAQAIPFFEKAVKLDPKFAFAWDNLGISYRRTNQFEKAEAAYKKSLEIDPKGKVPLQNLPVVYEKMDKIDKALKAYKNILDVYPGDAEAYFGSGRMYLLKEDFEKGLDEMCKAYNIYIKNNSPYRVDAEKIVNYIYSEMNKQGKAEQFKKILKDNNISME